MTDEEVACEMTEATKAEMWKLIQPIMKHAFEHREAYGLVKDGVTIETDAFVVMIAELFLINLSEMVGIDKAQSVIILGMENRVVCSEQKGQGSRRSAELCLQGLQVFRQKQSRDENRESVKQMMDRLWPECEERK